MKQSPTVKGVMHIAMKIFFILFLFQPALSSAAEVTLAWDANTESNIAGYKLYYDSDSDTEMYQGTDANEGDSPIVIYLKDLADPTSPTFTVTGLTTGQYYYFSLTAFNTDGEESDFSDEVGIQLTAPDISNSYKNATSPTASDSSQTSGTTSSGKSGVGCFITTATANNDTDFPMTAAGVFLLFAAAAAVCCRRSSATVFRSGNSATTIEKRGRG